MDDHDGWAHVERHGDAGVATISGDESVPTGVGEGDQRVDHRNRRRGTDRRPRRVILGCWSGDIDNNRFGNLSRVDLTQWGRGRGNVLWLCTYGDNGSMIMNQQGKATNFSKERT